MALINPNPARQFINACGRSFFRPVSVLKSSPEMPSSVKRMLNTRKLEVRCAKSSLAAAPTKALVFLSGTVFISIFICQLCFVCVRRITTARTVLNEGGGPRPSGAKPDFRSALSEPCKLRESISESRGPPTKSDVEAMEDPELVEHIVRNVLIDLGMRVPEPPDVVRRKLRERGVTPTRETAGIPNFDPSQGGGFTSKLLVPTFFSAPGPVSSKTRTFFEAGALDGVFHSVSYYLEQTLGWRGMLAEANPRKFNEIIDRSGRTSLLAPICLSPEPKPCLGVYRLYHPAMLQKRIPNRISWYGRLEDSLKPMEMGRGWRVSTTPVHCYPLYSLLLAGNLTQLDLLSLDLEGAEIDVLATLPWDKIRVKVVRLDLNNGELLNASKKLLNPKGYHFQEELVKNSFASKTDSHIFSKLEPRE